MQNTVQERTKSEDSVDHDMPGVVSSSTLVACHFVVWRGLQPGEILGEQVANNVQQRRDDGVTADGQTVGSSTLLTLLATPQ